MTFDLYIIAAGKGSRMGGTLPKALVDINPNEPCLTTTLRQATGRFKNIFVVTNESHQEPWIKYFATLRDLFGVLVDNVHNVPIASGLGDGHAVMHGLSRARAVKHASLVRAKNNPMPLADDVIVMWGDVFIQHAEIFDELMNMQMRHHSGILPAVRESNPYVSLLVNGKMDCMSADFSKYGENHPSGFHDQSVFRFDRGLVWEALSTLHAAYWKNGRYITPGGELSLLHAFHYLYNMENPLLVYETVYPTLSFNTPDEVRAIQTRITSLWLEKHQEF